MAWETRCLVPRAAPDRRIRGLTDVCFDLRAGVPVGTTRVLPEGANPGPVEGAEPFVWQVASRRGAMASRGKDGGRGALLLPPGRWLALWGEAANLQMRAFDVGVASETKLQLTGPR